MDTKDKQYKDMTPDERAVFAKLTYEAFREYYPSLTWDEFIRQLNEQNGITQEEAQLK
ncbi:hypothetical protein [Frigoriglobus tundricola]|uniref:Uncharacterized protein n=1 Tax=Frigoriglobus tundricola TaxID=2774151 RepID=A0A6M5YGS5_9BACT|nr:hypothetical protein [Frigoriglobus tundricola]QJW93249.1 hypothetical protein FTUN_0754 [Frigoriglobus tundricola]